MFKFCVKFTRIIRINKTVETGNHYRFLCELIFLKIGRDGEGEGMHPVSHNCILNHGPLLSYG